MRRFLVLMVVLMLLLVGAVGAFGCINEFELTETNGVVMPTIAVSASEVDSVMPLSQMQSAFNYDAITAETIRMAPCPTDCRIHLHIGSTQAHATPYNGYRTNRINGGVADRLIFPYNMLFLN